MADDSDYGPDPPPNKLVSEQLWAGPDNQYVTASLEDSAGWWWGTDNDGIWHYSPTGKPGFQWSHFRAEDGLYDDSITALCLDRKDRLWAGTERRGVAVYNNSGWRNYDVMTGPLGVHVTAIAMNPVDGAIWICSEDGIAIYSDQSGQWRYITETEGLSSNDLTCITFTQSGTAIVGTADKGLLISTASSAYRKWTSIVAAPAALAAQTGPGLSSNQVNCLTVNKAGKIFCGTSCGLSFSSDGGANWSYLHGVGWQIKVPTYVRSNQTITASPGLLPLSDDYISAIAFDRSGLIYIGHRFGGLEVISDADGTQLYHTKLNEYGTDIRTLTVLSRHAVLVGNYSEGLTEIHWTNADTTSETQPVPSHAPTLFPLPAAPPSLPDVAHLVAGITTPAPSATPAAYYLGEDWQTQGNWLGRYGNEFAVLCAADGNQDYVLGDQTGCSVTPTIGLALNGTTTPSHWLQWQQTGDPRVLFDPEITMRREAVWDDQGEQDEIRTEGPDIWLAVNVPAGMHRLGLYFLNNDGHTRMNRYRDYVLELRTAVTGVDYHQCYANPAALPLDAQVRVQSFWPGVFQQFAVGGPATYYVRINRNYSFNTIIQGVFLDPLGPAPASAQAAWLTDFNLGAVGGAEHHTTMPAPAKKLSEAQQLWAALDRLTATAASAPLQRILRIELIRAAAADGAPAALLTRWRIAVCLWEGDDWQRFASALTRFQPLAATKATVAPSIYDQAPRLTQLHPPAPRTN